MFPTVIAGIEGIGRGQDRESLMMFLQTISQALGPEAMMRFINPEEAIKRLAAAQGIDPIQLIKTAEERQNEMKQQQSQAARMSLMDQAGQLVQAPLMDPDKNPGVTEALQNTVNGIASAAQPAPQP